MIRPDKFTIKSQEAIAQAEDMAGKRGNPEIVPQHLLAALLAQADGVVVPILRKLGAPPESLSGETERLIGALSRVEGEGAAEARISPELKRVLEKAFDVADDLKDEYVSTEHLLVAMADGKGGTWPVCCPPTGLPRNRSWPRSRRSGETSGLQTRTRRGSSRRSRNTRRI